MASPATQPAPPPGRQAAYEGVAYEEFVDTRIRKTRAAVKTADLATGAVTLLAWALVVLLIGAVADHWLVAGGFDRWGRFALFTIGVLGAGLYVATRLGPTLFLRVNPLYAAKEIERESPELKNSLLNLLQLRGTPGAGAAAVQQTLERQAAEGLAATGDAPIDHSPVVRAARVLLVLVAAIGVYVVASPKDFFASAARVIAPWANIAAPSRVRITDLTPGEAELAQGGRLEIGARVTGLAEDELAEIVYSTADGRLVESRVPMRAAKGGQQHTASLPPGGGSAAALGLQGDLTYRLEAGDARTSNYRVEVRTAPTLAPVSVRYEYPTYTGLETREVEGVGDLRAIEGTRVTLTARANLPIATAQIDLGADGRPDFTMRAEGEQAVGRLTLRRDPADATQTTTSYVLRFTSTDDQANHNPPQYRVEVLADLPPEADLLAPEESTLEVAVDERVRIEAEARDPDFALGGMRLVGELNGRRVLGRDLLRGERQGRITGGTNLTPSEVGARPGDTLTYWVEATDNRTPKANVGLSERQQLRITGPSEDAKGDPDQGDPREGQGKPDGPAQPNPKGDPEAGEPSQGSGEKGQPGGEPSDPSDANKGQEQQPSGASERPQAEQSEDGQDGDSPDGGLRGPGEQGGDQGESEETPDGGSEGDPNGESGADPQAGGTGSESSDGNQPQDGASEGAGGENNGGASRPAGEQGTNDGQADGESPVPSNGEDDGAAFERIRKFLQDQQGNGQDSQRPPRDGGEQGGQQQEGQQQTGKQQDGKQPSGQQQDARDAANDPATGVRGKPSPEEQGGSGESQDGSEKGNPSPRDGANGDQGKQPERPEDGPGPGERDRGGKSSDSQTNESGGETPPGDSTDPDAGPREGTGSSGQNQAADQGAGQSSDQGAGDSSGRPGGEQQADGETGESGGEQPGEGSQSRGGGDQPGGGDDSQQPGNGEKANQQDPSDSKPSGNSGEAGSGDSGSDAGSEGNEQQPLQDQRGEGSDGKSGDQQGKPVGFGDRGENSGEAGEGSEVGGDEANLEYAREQTDLVLERLEEQLAEREVDRKLLDKLGWTEQELQRFVERWKSRKQKATQRGAEGEAQLDRALRSLGLRPEGPAATRPVADDQLRDLREGVRTKVPARWRDAVQRYNRSLNASGRSATDDE